MKTTDERLDIMDRKIHSPSMRQNTGRANEINYWIFDYDPKDELKVREKIKNMQLKNRDGNDDFKLVVYDLYDMIIDILEQKGYVDKVIGFEKANGLDKVNVSIGRVLKIDSDMNLIVNRIVEKTPDNSVVFLIGIGKCYPLLRSHKILNTLNLSFKKSPVVLFFPGTYDGQTLKLFNEVTDDNYYRAFRLVDA